MKALQKWIPRLYGISAIIWVLIYWVWKYTEVTVVESTQSSMGIIPLLIISVLVLVITIGGFVIMLLSWWETVKKDKFGFKTFLPFYVLIIGLMVLGKLGVHKLYVLIELNSSQFMLDLLGYDSTMNNSLFILGSGLLVGIIGMVRE